MPVFRNMTIDRKVLYALASFLFCALLVLIFVPNNVARYVCTAFLPLMCVAICWFIKKRNILSINKREVLLIFAVIGVLYVTLYYVTGIFFGFTPNPYTPISSVIFTHVIPITIVIIAIEIIRSVLMAQGDSFVKILVYLSGVAAEIIVFSSMTGVNTFNQFMDLVGIVILPALSSNLLYNYVSSKYGLLPNIVYRLLKTLPMYFIPYASAVPQSLFAFFELLLPLLILAFVYALYENKGKRATAKPGWISKSVSAVCVILMIFLVMLISCQFEYAIIVVGSESMTGEINKGDAVFYEDYDPGDEIKNGDVLVFNKDGVLTVHRVIDIQYVNATTRYYTKGDANPTPDDGYVTDQDVVGISKFKIAYVGYPTIWLRQLFTP